MSCASTFLAPVAPQFIKEDGIAVFTLIGEGVTVEALRNSLEAAHLRMYYDNLPVLSRYMNDTEGSIDRRLDTIIEELDMIRSQYMQLNSMLGSFGNGTLPDVYDLAVR